jgi:hypothetical protein
MALTNKHHTLAITKLPRAQHKKYGDTPYKSIQRDINHNIFGVFARTLANSQLFSYT